MSLCMIKFIFKEVKMGVYLLIKSKNSFPPNTLLKEFGTEEERKILGTTGVKLRDGTSR